MSASDSLPQYGRGSVTNNYYGGASGAGGAPTNRSAGGEPDWGMIIGQILSGGYDLYRSSAGGNRGDVGRAREAAAMADPFASQRPQY